MIKERIDRLAKNFLQSYRSIIFQHKKLYKQQGWTVSCTFAFIVAFFLFALVQVAPAKAVAEARALKQVIVRYNYQESKLETKAVDVQAVINQLGLQLTPLDKVTPGLQTAITDEEDGFKIDIKRINNVRVIDGEQIYHVETTEINPYRMVAEVADLDYPLDDDDLVVWGDYDYDDNNLLTIKSIEILRINEYQLDIDGQPSEAKSSYQTVSEVLSDWGYSTKKIAYLSPSLDSQLESGDKIILYYEQPQQAIEIESKQVITGNLSQEKELVHLINYNQAGEVSKSHIIDKRVISQQLITPQAAASASPSAALIARPMAAMASSTLTSALSPTALSAASQAQAASNQELQVAAGYSHGHNRPATLSPQQQQWLRAANISESDWFFVDYIITKESNWRHNVWNRQGSSAYGLCQTILSIHAVRADFMKDPVTQLKWCDQYAQKRYKNWHEAYHAWQRQRWW